MKTFTLPDMWRVFIVDPMGESTEYTVAAPGPDEALRACLGSITKLRRNDRWAGRDYYYTFRYKRGDHNAHVGLATIVDGRGGACAI